MNRARIESAAPLAVPIALKLYLCAPLFRIEYLARVVPRGHLVTAAPLNGLDTQQLERFVQALDEEALPQARFQWRGRDRP